jgi:hypothetical protein
MGHYAAWMLGDVISIPITWTADVLIPLPVDIYSTLEPSRFTNWKPHANLRDEICGGVKVSVPFFSNAWSTM